MTDVVQRRVALRGDRQSAGAARDAVLGVLADADLRHLAHEAAILTTELATHKALYTGADVSLRVEADDRGLMVTLSDRIRRAIEPFEPAIDGSPALELLDRLASAWGTRHDGKGKSVWFRIDATQPDGTRDASPVQTQPDNGTAANSGSSGGPGGAAPSGSPPLSAAETSAVVSYEQLARWLTYIPEHVTRHLTTEQTLAELLARLCEVIGAASAVLWIAEGANAGPRPLAWHGLPAPPDASDLSDPGRGDVPETATATGAPVAAPARVAESVLRHAGAACTVGVTVPLGTPLQGGLDLGFADTDSLGAHSATLAMLSAERIALILETSRARETEVRRRGFLVFLAEASELLANSLDVELTMMLVAQLCVTRLGEWCAIHTPGPHGRPELAAAVHVDERQLEALQGRFSGDRGDPIEQRLRQVAYSASVVTLPDDLAGIAVPLSARRQVVGTMSIGAPNGRRHTPEEIAIAEDLGRRAGLALLNARLYQERATVAAALQRGLLPASLPTADGLEFGASYVPAGDGNQVGGDFYDVVPMGEDRWLLAIGDVCGKGPEAASVTGVVRDVIRVLVREGRPLPYVLTALNAALLEQRNRSGFCTVAAALAERRGSLIHVKLCLAGHMLPVILRADGSVDLIGEIGMAVGVFEHIEVGAIELDLQPGDAVVFYTDGVTERRDGAIFFGESTLLDTLRGRTELDGPGIATLVQVAAADFATEPPRDDIAVLVLRNKP